MDIGLISNGELNYRIFRDTTEFPDDKDSVKIALEIDQEMFSDFGRIFSIFCDFSIDEIPDYFPNLLLKCETSEVSSFMEAFLCLPLETPSLDSLQKFEISGFRRM